MYGRRRGGGRGFRHNNNNNPVGNGSRVSPDGPMRGGFNNSGYRNFGRGFGRGKGRYFQCPQPLHKEDLFMEAGRLAAEYLVAKGMLPQNALPQKFQNGGYRKEVGEFHEFRQQEGEYVQLESRTPALARLGSFERGSDMKQYSNDYGTSGSKNNIKGAREKGFNDYDSNRGQENGKSGSISGLSGASSDKEAADDALSAHHDDQLATKDDEQNVKVVKLVPESNGTENLPSEPLADTHQLVNDLAGKVCDYMTNMEGDEESDGTGNTNVEDEEMKESVNEEVTGQHHPHEDSVIQLSQVAGTFTCQKGNELLQLCNFAKVPTRTRSPRSKGSKGNHCKTIEEENISAGTSTDVDVAKSIDCDVIDRSLVNPLMEQPPIIDEKTSTGTPVVIELLVDDDAVVGLSESNAVVDQNLDLTTTKSMLMNNSDSSFGKAILLDHDGSADGSKSLESLSFPVRSFAYLEESSRGPQDSNCPGSLDEFEARERGEKHLLDECKVGGTFKKLKSWRPSMIGQADEYPHLPNLSTEVSTVIKRTSPTNNLMIIPQESSSHISRLTALGNDNSVVYAEDKQMIDNSFKICDLNLMEGSHIDDCYNGSQMMFFPSMSGIKKDPLSVDGGLTIGDNSNMSSQYSTVGNNGREVQVINLDDDFADDRVFNPGERRGNAIYTGLESFPSELRGNSNGTDGYGLMISELLGNEIPNCSTVAGNINSMHNDMGLHNGQGMLPEDDSIYMTLGEIPIGFWEPPNPEFGKPF